MDPDDELLAAIAEADEELEESDVEAELAGNDPAAPEVIAP